MAVTNLEDIKWRRKMKEHLEKGEFGPGGYCCLKLRSKSSTPPGGIPFVNFGVVYPDDVCKIYLRDEAGNITTKTQEWDSIDEMFDAGWEID